MNSGEVAENKKKVIGKALVVIGLIAIVSTIMCITILSAKERVEHIAQKYFKSAKVEAYNEDYLLIKASEYMTDKERLTYLRNICNEVSKIKLKNNSLVVCFYDETWSNITRTVTIDMKNVYNTDWENITKFDELKSILSINDNTNESDYIIMNKQKAHYIGTQNKKTSKFKIDSGEFVIKWKNAPEDNDIGGHLSIVLYDSSGNYVDLVANTTSSSKEESTYYLNGEYTLDISCISSKYDIRIIEINSKVYK